MMSTATISAVVAIIGIIFKMFVKKANYKNVGDIMLGFAILMVGMQTMSGAVSPLKDNPHFVNLLTKFEKAFNFTPTNYQDGIAATVKSMR